MKILNNYLSSEVKIETYKTRIFSNASRSNYKFKPYLNIKLKFKKFMFFKKKNFAGRSSNGRITLLSKGSKSQNHILPIINYSFRDNRLSFISNITFIPKTRKFVSTIIMPSGASTNVITTVYHKLFVIKSLINISYFSKPIFISMTKVNPFYNFEKYITTLINLPKNKPVCLLEQHPSIGIKFSRASGSVSKILKMDSRTGLGIVKLPSGFTKIFSIYGLGSEGWVLPFDKTKFNSNRAGYYRSLGNKPIVRGVAKNPVDHPHGGRTKTVKYPRTPWGLTAKRK